MAGSIVMMPSSTSPALGSGDQESPDGPRPPVGPRSRWWTALRYVVGLGLAGVALWAVLGRRGELSGLSGALGHLRPEWVVLAVAAEAGSYIAFATAQRRLLAAAGVPVGLRPVAAIVFVTTAITNSVPAGPVVSTVFGFRRFQRCGADDVEAAWVLLATFVAAGASLALVAAVGLGVAGAEGADSGLIGVTAGVVALAAAGTFLLVQRRAAMWAARKVAAVAGPVARPVARSMATLARRIPAASGTGKRGSWARISLAWARTSLARVRRSLASLGTVHVRPTDMASAVLWTGGNWVLDCACLVLSFLAVGAPVPWRGLLLAYGAGQLAANLPITPGGLGVVEGSMTIALVAFGGDVASTATAVLVYRVFSYWAPLPFGWALWGGMAWTDRRRAPSGAVRHAGAVLTAGAEAGSGLGGTMPMSDGGVGPGSVGAAGATPVPDRGGGPSRARVAWAGPAGKRLVPPRSAWRPGRWTRAVAGSRMAHLVGRHRALGIAQDQEGPATVPDVSVVPDVAAALPAEAADPCPGAP
ncbi:MAG: YbhN family protein [Actinomycetota bacterium]|nr:YbhN family protein [Actinomycetota bacterium]